jgi:hypothetical protein
MLIAGAVLAGAVGYTAYALRAQRDDLDGARRGRPPRRAA